MLKLRTAEVIDAYRVFPRLTLLAFIISVGVTMQWYFDFPTAYVVQCNSELFTNLIDRNVPLLDAERISCRQVSVIDRPTGYTALTSVLIGASAGVFGFYANTGRKWNDKPNSNSGDSSPRA